MGRNDSGPALSLHDGLLSLACMGKVQEDRVGITGRCNSRSSYAGELNWKSNHLWLYP